MHAEMLRVGGTGEFYGVFEQMVDNGHVAQDILKFDTHFSRFTPGATREKKQASPVYPIKTSNDCQEKSQDAPAPSNYRARVFMNFS